MDNKNLPAVIQTALQTIEIQKKRGSLVYIGENEIQQIQSVFIPDVSILETEPTDFHDMHDGKFMFKAPIVDRIAEYSGVFFIPENDRVEIINEDIVIGYSQGKRRLPDGTWRTSKVEAYEFDCKTRAELDFITDEKGGKGRYKTEIAKKQHLLELRKVRVSRASTGSRLRVIHSLLGMPLSFTADQLKKTKVFYRVVLNTNQLLSDPDIRKTAIAGMLGATGSIFGNETEETERLKIAEKPIQEVKQIENGENDFDFPEETQEKERDQIADIIRADREFITEYAKQWGGDYLEKCLKWLASPAGSDPEELAKKRKQIEEREAGNEI